MPALVAAVPPPDPYPRGDVAERRRYFLLADSVAKGGDWRRYRLAARTKRLSLLVGCRDLRGYRLFRCGRPGTITAVSVVLADCSLERPWRLSSSFSSSL